MKIIPEDETQKRLLRIWNTVASSPGIGQEIGLHQHYLADMIRGTITVDFELVKKMEAALGLDADNAQNEDGRFDGGELFENRDFGKSSQFGLEKSPSYGIEKWHCVKKEMSTTCTFGTWTAARSAGR